ncbi:hypothetical protein EA58_11420 [Photobacterium galatheae]|uniref:Uncharacterized protein n=1 Tax=Photobacterium galatheae TaxID=1654360 RepID=A0A066RW71_9GAMM|nr:hypothetical protein EA58_11420 [Photobacterium galatheae]
MMPMIFINLSVSHRLPNLKRSKRRRIVTLFYMMVSLNGKGMGIYAYRCSKVAVNQVMQYCMKRASLSVRFIQGK